MVSGHPDAALDEYRAKRHVGRTPEPEGAISHRSDERTTFVIQEHHARALHWDLRLEWDGVLASWAVPKGLPCDPSANHLAARTEDHPLAYADFEGEIPAGEYGAGTVSIWDRGTAEIVAWTADEIVFELEGTHTHGRYALIRTSRADWLLHRMDPAPDGWETLPTQLSPMLASSRALPSETDGWAFEPKWDGLRALCFVEGGRIRLMSRNDRDLTANYPELRPFGPTFGSTQALVDGEIIAFDTQGQPDFGMLQTRMHVANAAHARRLAAAHPVTFVVFDLLQFDGHVVRGLSYDRRRELLVGLDLQGPHWSTSPAWTDIDVEAVLDATRDLGLEGIVAKERSSRYEPGVRSASWRKIKHHLGQEVVVGGWTVGSGDRSGELGALLVGVYDAEDLMYAGRVGTGFERSERRHLLDVLESLEQATSAFVTPVRNDGAVHWASPELVVEVEFAEWTAAGHLRHATYRGIRIDKAADEVTRER